ncbi:MAG: invasion associated locus B family protein [Pelagimonas sp.]
MKKSLLLVSLVAAMSAAPAFAQTAEEAAPAADQAEGIRAGGNIDLGQTEAPQGPRSYFKEGFKDWKLQCVEVESAEEDVCQMYQLLTTAEGASVAEVSIFQLKDAGQAVAGGTFVVPLETLLTQKLRISVDGSKARIYDYSFCNQIGCYARVGFTQEDINRFKAGAKATVTLIPALAPDQKVELNMSLTGFTAAFEASTAMTQ